MLIVLISLLIISVVSQIQFIQNQQRQLTLQQITVNPNANTNTTINLGTPLLSISNNVPNLWVQEDFTPLDLNTTQILNNTQQLSLNKKIFAGQIHYARIPVQYWEHRIQMVKALGLNTLSIRVMWNYHQKQKGIFDFQTQNKNLSLFLSLASKHQLNVIIRPGPSVESQWDFGGLPVRLLAIKDIKIRQNDVIFLEEVKLYFSALAPIIKNHLNTDGTKKSGIILLQIENQYGRFGKDIEYLNALRKIWTDLGVNCRQFHQDKSDLAQFSHWKGAGIGLSDGTSQKDYSIAKKLQQNGLIFGGQIFVGGFTYWGQFWTNLSTTSALQKFRHILPNNISFCLYMAHGGTNFGLTAGGNYKMSNDTLYRSVVTSYDYSAPINQQGRSTPKYKQLKKLFSQHAEWTIPSEPNPIETISIQNFKVSPYANMLLNIGLPSITNSQKMHHFQSEQLKMFNQGFVIYQTAITKGTYRFRAAIKDFALVVLDDDLQLQIDRNEQQQSNFTINCHKQQCNLKIIVQAMGHMNFHKEMKHNLKGIFNLTYQRRQKSPIFITPSTKLKWNIYKIQINQQMFKWKRFDQKIKNTPTLFKTTLKLNKIGDTYIDFKNFTKGYIFVNGRNLGRYWKKGPQKRLFCPGVWLKQGNNEIIVLQMLPGAIKDKFIFSRPTLQDI